MYMSVLSSLSVDEKLAVDCKTDKFYQKYVYKGTEYGNRRSFCLLRKRLGRKYVG